MPTKLIIEVDGKRVAVERQMSEAEAREWLFDQAVRLTRRDPIVVEAEQTSTPSREQQGTDEWDVVGASSP